MTSNVSAGDFGTGNRRLAVPTGVPASVSQAGGQAAAQAVARTDSAVARVGKCLPVSPPRPAKREGHRRRSRRPLRMARRRRSRQPGLVFLLPDRVGLLLRGSRARGPHDDAAAQARGQAEQLLQEPRTRGPHDAATTQRRGRAE